MSESIKKEYDDFVYSVSHDLSAPFRQIKGYTNLLMDEMETLSETQKAYQSRIFEAINHAESMLDSLLKFSRINTQAIDIQPIAVKSFIDNITTHYNCEIIAEDLPDYINADHNLLTTIINELITNAVKFNKDYESLRITISGKNKNDATVLTIDNNGLAIDEKLIEKAILPLQQLHPKGEYIGDGIGLSICQKIMAIHGGSLKISSNAEQAFRVDLTFPN